MLTHGFAGGDGVCGSKPPACKLAGGSPPLYQQQSQRQQAGSGRCGLAVLQPQRSARRRIPSFRRCQHTHTTAAAAIGAAQAPHSALRTGWGRVTEPPWTTRQQRQALVYDTDAMVLVGRADADVKLALEPLVQLL